MGLFGNIFGKKQPAAEQQPANKMINDIKSSTQWIVMAMLSSGYQVDFTMESMK